MSTNIEYASIVINRFEVQNSVKTFELSTKYLKRITKLAMLNIIKRRLEIPDNEFIEKNAFDQVPYFVFKRKSENRFIQAHHKYGTGILDALEKGYLKQWELGIVNKTTKKLLESYRFQYKYNIQEKSGTKDPEKVCNAMVDLLKSIQNLPGAKWPENLVDLVCEIGYEESTPTTYESPHFRPIVELKSVNHFVQEFQLIGEINTGFHGLSGQARGLNFDAVTPVPVIGDQQTVDNENQVSEKQQEFMQKGRESFEIRPESPVIKMLGKQSNNKRVNFDQIMESPPKKAKLSDSIELKSSELASVLSQELENCACEWRNLGPTFELINCSKCLDPVHAVCNGYFDLQAIDAQNFICLSCTLSNKSKNRAQAHLRLILYGLYNGEREPAVLRNAKKSVKKFLMGKLETEGIIQPGTKLINRVALEHAIRRQFIVDQNSANLI